MRLTRFFLFLLSGLSPYLGAQSIINMPSTAFSKIRLLDSERQPVAQFPFFWVRGTEIIALQTDEFGERLIPEENGAILRVAADMGRISGDSIWFPNRGEFIIETQIGQINPVSITASVNPRLATDNPYAIQVISRKTIEKMAAQNVADVLQNQSGVLLGQDPSLGASVQLQGLGGQNVKILINGVPMIGRLNGSIDVSQIPSENIERIEIVEGPMSVVYGTDAIGGVINIITKQPMRMSSRSRVKLFTDQIGNFNIDGSVSEYRTLKKGSAWGFDATMGRQFFRGFDFDPETRSMDWKPKTRIYGDASVFYQRKKWKQSVRYAQYYEYLMDRSNAEFNLINISGYNNYFYTQRRDVSAVTDVKLNDRHSLRFQNSYNRYDREKRNVRRNLVTGTETLTRPGDQDTTLNTAFNLRGLWEYHPKKSRFNTLLGYDIQQEQISTLRVKQMRPILDAALFGSLEYNPIPQLNIKPSLRLAYNSVFGQNPLPQLLGEGFKLAPIIPSLQIKSALSEHLVLRGSYARGFRAPTAKELYFLFVDINHNVQGNESLQTEHSHNFNLSIDYRHSIAKDVAATFKIASFRNAVSNEIQLSLVDLGTNLYQYINIGMLNSAGISSQTQLFLGKWDITLGFSYISNESQIDAQSGMRRWRVPQSTLNVSHEWKQSGTAVQWFSRYTGKTLGFMNTGTVYEIEPYGLADINLTQKIYKNRVLLQLGVKNLFNVSQIQNTAPNTGVHAAATGGINIAMGRNLFLQCTVNL